MATKRRRPAIHRRYARGEGATVPVPITLTKPEAAWVREHAQTTGKSIGLIIGDALAVYRERLAAQEAEPLAS